MAGTRSKNKNGMGSLYKRENGRFEFRITYVDENGDKRRKSFYGDTEDECFDQADDFIDQFSKNAEDEIHQFGGEDVFLEFQLGSADNVINGLDIGLAGVDPLAGVGIKSLLIKDDGQGVVAELTLCIAHVISRRPVAAAAASPG